MKRPTKSEVEAAMAGVYGTRAAQAAILRLEVRAQRESLEELPEHMRVELLRLLDPEASHSSSYIIGCMQELVFRILRGES